MEFIRWYLLIYFIVFFLVAFLLKTLVVAKRIKKNPFVLPKDDSAYGLIGKYFKLTLISLFLYVLILSLFPDWYHYFLPMEYLELAVVRYVGVVLLLGSIVLTVVAQNNMHDSWRIGIDTETRTHLITSGLFSYSRNPIFLGMITSLLGLFLVTPNAVTLILLILGYVLIQIQIRLEEEFLVKEHGSDYIKYKAKVRRFI